MTADAILPQPTPATRPVAPRNAVWAYFDSNHRVTDFNDMNEKQVIAGIGLTIFSDSSSNLAGERA